MTRKASMFFVVLVLLVTLVASSAMAYTGSMSSLLGELQGTGVWATGDTTLSWVVTWDNTNNWWHYSYHLVVPRGDVSHMIVEASDNFTANDVMNAAGPFTPPVLVDTYSDANGNPSMPGTVYGIKFNETTGTDVTVSFDSYRTPVWGDFYAKDGRDYTIWNSGFAAADPTAPAADGAYLGHLLVPDSVVPEPATFVALGLGLSGILAARKKSK